MYALATIEYPFGSIRKQFISNSDIVKHIYSSKGKGIYRFTNIDEFDSFFQLCSDLSKYIIKKYYSYLREYRLHIDKFRYFHVNSKDDEK